MELSASWSLELSFGLSNNEAIFLKEADMMNIKIKKMICYSCSRGVRGGGQRVWVSEIQEGWQRAWHSSGILRWVCFTESITHIHLHITVP